MSDKPSDSLTELSNLEEIEINPNVDLQTPSSECTDETSETLEANTSTFTQNYESAIATTFESNEFHHFSIPIIGYEVTEEKSKFTVFKLKIENKTTGDCWYVFRRYTDFSRLYTQLKTEFPSVKLILPKKKWFGNNFKPEFIEERIDGLQDFIDSILNNKDVCSSVSVKAFFCLDEPPANIDTIEDARAIMEALEETIYHLRKKLKQKELEHEKLKSAHSLEIRSKLRLASFIQECTKDCKQCAIRFSNISLNTYKTD